MATTWRERAAITPTVASPAYRVRDDVPIPRLPPRGAGRSSSIRLDDPLYLLLTDMGSGQSFEAPFTERPKISQTILAVRGADPRAMFITRKIVRRYRGREIEKLGVWRI